MPELCSRVIPDMDRLVILDSKAGKLSKELQKKFSVLVSEVVVARDFDEKDQFIIDLDLLRRESGDAAIQSNFRAFERARKYANFEHNTGMYVYVGSTGFNEVDPAWKAGFLGLAKTAALEWPDIFVKAIGIDHPRASHKNLVQSIFNEVLKGGVDTEVFYDDKLDRYQLVLDEVIGERPKTGELKDNAVVLATGGGKGITADCLIELAAEKKLRLAILGRSELFEEPPGLQQWTEEKDLKVAVIKDLKAQGKKIDLRQVSKEVHRIQSNREIKNTLQQMKSLGSEVSYYATDVTDLKQMEKTVSEICDVYGEIDAIIHGAGVLADKTIIDKTDDQFARVFNTKVLGFENLLEVTKDQPLTHVCCFTSISARFGNPGQADYAMANEILNKRCIQLKGQKGSQCNIKTINWGPWEGGMVDAMLLEHFKSIGLGVISREDGIKTFVSELNYNSDNPEVLVGVEIDSWIKKAPKAKTFSSWVHQATFPVFTDHAIKGVEVVPMVTITNQSLYIGEYLFNSAEVTAVDVRVMKGVKIPAFHQEGLWLHYEVNEQNDGSYAMNVYCKGAKVPSYKIIIRNEQPQPLSLPDSIPGSRPYEKDELLTFPGYFHGPSMQAVRSMINYSLQGADFEVDELAPEDLDLKLMDGALQATCLQATVAMEAQVAPLSCEAFRWYRRPAPDAKLLYKLRVVDQNKLGFNSNIQLIDKESEEVYFEFVNVHVFTYEMGLVG